MTYEILYVAVLLVLALIVNKLIGKWHSEALRFYRREEEGLQARLVASIKKQKRLMIKLRDVKAQISVFENMIPDDVMSEKIQEVNLSE